MSQFINNPEHTFGFDTLQLHVGQESADPASDSRAVPIYQTTSYVFRNSQHAADRFGLADAGNIYGRLTNSTQGVFEDRIAALEGGVAGLAVASGAAAITYTLQALAQAGDHVVAQKTIYGGSYNLLEHTLSQFGVETTFVDAHNLDEVEGAIRTTPRSSISRRSATPTPTSPTSTPSPRSPRSTVCRLSSTTPSAPRICSVRWSMVPTSSSTPQPSSSAATAPRWAV